MHMLAWLGAMGLVLGACQPLIFYRLADRDLWSSHEGRAAQDAQTALDDGCWAVPRLFDRHPELQKPPLYYWLVAGTACLRGSRVDAWAVRLPSAVAATGGVAVLALAFLLLGRPLAGVLGALVLATALHYTWLARVGRIDMPLTLTVTLALFGFYIGRGRQREQCPGAWALYLLAYGAVAAGLLLKGPIAVVLPGAAALAWLVAEGDLRPYPDRRWLQLPKEFGALWGVPLVIGLAAPWYVWAVVETHGSLFKTFFWYHNFERAFGGAATLRAHPWWFYGPRFAVDFLPWTPLLLGAGLYLLVKRRWRQDAESRFGMIWLASMVLVMSCVRFKRADYLLPAYPGAALIVGCALERWWKSTSRPGWLAAGFLVAVASCVVGWPLYVQRVLPKHEPAREYQRFAAAIRRLAPAPQLVLFFRAEAHALAFHVGNPVDTFLEWENLDVWAGRPGPNYIVMPPECAADWTAHVTSGVLEEVLRNRDLPSAECHDHPLVLMRTRPRATTECRQGVRCSHQEGGLEKQPGPSALSHSARRRRGRLSTLGDVPKPEAKGGPWIRSGPEVGQNPWIPLLNANRIYGDTIRVPSIAKRRAVERVNWLTFEIHGNQLLQRGRPSAVSQSKALGSKGGNCCP
jgi:4-amino-4-deoxy-L-arabinose transferase-like glycosyltransferase